MERTAIIGDVHGCSAELDELIKLLALTPADQVLFVGDLVGRGPDSRGVLERVRGLGARSVLGNHERALLAARRATSEGAFAPRLGRSGRELMQELTPGDWALLSELPAWLELRDHRIWLVHAGVLPGLNIERQPLEWLTSLRSFDADGTPSARAGGTSWASTYSGEAHVVFGHDAISGLQIHPRATGLDTGCVYGGRLTALVLERGQPVPDQARRPHALVSVTAARSYYRPRKRERDE